MDLRFRERMTPELFIRAQKLHMGHRWVAMIIFPIGMGLYIFFGPYSGISSLATKLAAFPLTFLFPAAMYWLTRRQWLKIYRGSPYFSDEATGAISEDGIHYSSAHGSSTIPWRLFVKLRYSGELMLLYQSPAMFRVVSRDFFENEPSWREAVGYVKQRIARPVDSRAT